MIRKSTPDEQGNYFIVNQVKDWLTISLKLATESKDRELGKVNLKNRVLEIKRIKSKHLFKKNNSYGFNEHLIKTGLTFDKILFSDGERSFLFPKELILQKGSYLHFKQLGFEKQLFLQVSEMENYLTQILF